LDSQPMPQSQLYRKIKHLLCCYANERYFGQMVHDVVLAKALITSQMGGQQQQQQQSVEYFFECGVHM